MVFGFPDLWRLQRLYQPWLDSPLFPYFRYRDIADPQLFAQQRLTETLGRLMTNAQDKIFMAQPADGKRRELRLLLNRAPLKESAGQK